MRYRNLLVKLDRETLVEIKGYLSYGDMGLRLQSKDFDRSVSEFIENKRSEIRHRPAYLTTVTPADQDWSFQEITTVLTTEEDSWDELDVLHLIESLYCGEKPLISANTNLGHFYWLVRTALAGMK